jgi:MFS family permease
MLVALALTTAVIAAVRSTWSPCGLSMLSTLIPLSETARGRRWGWTASWYVTGAVVGGTALGTLGAAAAALVDVVGPGTTAVWVTVAVAALVGVALDLGLVAPIPHHRRQVDEAWLDQFRSWVYGFGFGAQIGAGLATYIMTSGVYLTIVLGALTGRPSVAFGIGVLFGATRGAAVLLGARLTTAERVRALHARLDRLAPASQQAAAAWLAVVALAAGWAAAGVAGVVAAALAATALGAAVAIRSRTPARPGPTAPTTARAGHPGGPTARVPVGSS